ncbi:MAG: zinc dependent phospholipase C family protein [Erysipelotrichaceae bacterium]|nr:zinc dependent phospholipase C family protein [Erysipelotrichaceae bacterium]
MPNIITHVLFARDMMDNKLDAKKMSLVEKNPQLFEVGSNGPDFLFFHDTTPKHVVGKSRLRKLGTFCHRRNINDFYHDAFQTIRNEKNKTIREQETIYLMGHLCHWALDSVAHPYIFYRTGSGDTKAQFRHHRIESLIDAAMLKVKTGQTVKQFKAHEICKVSMEDARAITRIYHSVAEHVYGIKERPYEFLQALNDWYSIQKLLNDGNGKKIKTFQAVERLIGQIGLVSAMIVPKNPVDPCDICNLLHKEWVHPCDKALVSDDSFMDLYDKALNRADHVIDLFWRALKDPKSEQQWLDYIANRNYTKGTSDNLPMVYFDPEMESYSSALLKG